MPSQSAFLRFWFTDKTRDRFLSHVEQEDLPKIRLVCHDFSVRVTSRLFREVTINFRSNTFTRPARIGALERIGRYVRKLTFNMPHSDETFLPPLLEPFSGDEVEFVYTPSCQTAKTPGPRVSNTTYGSFEITDLLVKQYPPLFHAAANVASFVRAFANLTGLRELTIACSEQGSALGSARSIVDHALISLRIAIERNPLKHLRDITLSPIHLSAMQYLNPIMGPGSRPSSLRRWRQIRSLTIHAPVTSSPSHLKLLHAYLATFSPSITTLTFHWLEPPVPSHLAKPVRPSSTSASYFPRVGTPPPESPRGPLPLSLHTSPTLTSPSPHLACPQRGARPLPTLTFPKLSFFEVDGVACRASDIASFIARHGKHLAEFKFEATRLEDGGDWDEALEPLTRLCGSERWKKEARREEEVPIILGPEVGQEVGGLVKKLSEEMEERKMGRNAGGGGRHGPGRSPMLGMGVGGAMMGMGVGCEWDRRLKRGKKLLGGQKALEDGVRKLLAQTVFPFF